MNVPVGSCLSVVIGTPIPQIKAPQFNLVCSSVGIPTSIVSTKINFVGLALMLAKSPG